MGRGYANVLWELQPTVQSDAAYHRGADISMLSQFAGEKEVLFPPCTMLVVKHAPASQPAAQLSELTKLDAMARLDSAAPNTMTVDGGKSYIPVTVLPCFV